MTDRVQIGYLIRINEAAPAYWRLAEKLVFLVSM